MNWISTIATPLIESNINIGIGACHSATYGAKVVKILAVKLQMPKADAEKSVGNILEVAI